MKYIAVAIKDDYWICLSKPCSLFSAKKFKGSEMIGEQFEIKTEEEVNNYKRVLR
jgi:hypothetical protein